MEKCSQQGRTFWKENLSGELGHLTVGGWNERYWAVRSCGVAYYAVQGGSNVLRAWIKSSSVTIQMNATEQYFPVMWLIMPYKVVLAFESLDEILKCDHSNERYWAVLSSGVTCEKKVVLCKVWIVNDSSTRIFRAFFLCCEKYVNSKSQKPHTVLFSNKKNANKAKRFPETVYWT